MKEEEIGGGKRKYEKMVEEEEVPKSKSPKVKGSEGRRHLKVTNLTLKKVHLVLNLKKRSKTSNSS